MSSTTTATNPFLSALAPVLNAPIADIQAGLQSIIATPTIENATAQGEKLALDALNPTSLQGVGIGAAAQEALNLISALQSHLNSAVAAPTAVPASAS